MTIGLLVPMLGIVLCSALVFLTPHLHIGTTQPEGSRSSLSKTTMQMLAVTIHHFPKGMAIGVVLAGAGQAEVGISAANVLVVSLGIAIQKFPRHANYYIFVM